MSGIKIGPAGLGPVKTAEEVLNKYNKLGIKICEIAFTYSVYIKKPEAQKIKKIAEELGIELSIHAPYFVNLNSDDDKKIEATKQRILKCCEIGHEIGAKNIVFHPGYYGKDKDASFTNIKLRIKELIEEVRKNNWDVKLCPETMGKVNVFGSPEEISKLAEETGCSFCIDFAHILAREKKVDYDKIEILFPQKHWHCHFSGIVYGEKGEKHHIPVEDIQWRELFKNLPKDKTISIICEAPDTVGDSVKGLGILKEN
jgi:deoxyribonuclease-4